MADRPEFDDDESAVAPEVTVPPWLRSGPTPGRADSPTPAIDRSTSEGSPAGRREAGEGTPQTSSPNRITLGTREPQASPAEPPEGQGGSRQSDDDLSTLPLRYSHVPAEATPAPDLPADARESGAAVGATYPLGSSPADTSPAAISPAEPTGSVGGPAAPAGPTPATAEGPSAGSSGSPASAGSGRGRRFALLAAAGVAILAGTGVLGYLLVRGATAGTVGEAAGCVELEEPGRVAGSGPGSLETPAGAVLVFDHAYYVDRSAEKAWEAVSPSSRMSEEQLRTDGVEQVPEGTTHCVEIEEISPTLLEVTLTEFPPEAEPVEIPQRIRMAENSDGTWGIVSITPAG